MMSIFKTVVTAKNKLELQMRIDDLTLRGFKVDKIIEPESKFSSGYIQVTSNNGYGYDKKQYISGNSTEKHRAVLSKVN